MNTIDVPIEMPPHEDCDVEECVVCALDRYLAIRKAYLLDLIVFS